VNELKAIPTRITFWQNMPSIHQSAQIRSLIDMGFEVTVVVEGNIDSDRLALGWKSPDFGSAHLIICPSQGQISSIAFTRTTETIHLIGGLRGYSLAASAFAACKRAKARMGLLCEGGNPLGFGGVARRFLYIAQWIKYGGDIDFVLAMGQNGVSWYRQCGWPSNKVFPYAYITESFQIGGLDNQPDLEKNTFEILYVGQLIFRKGVDILLQALQHVSKENWRLSIAGTGPLQSEYVRKCQEFGIDKHVEFLGVLPNDTVNVRIAHADLLVLPSRFDGWGAVVNEALMNGVPVICSDQCGAADLLREDWRGAVFPAESVQSLTELLKTKIGLCKNSPEMRNKIRTWSHCIEGEIAASYIRRVFAHVYRSEPRPNPPWY